jgi:hypothetical protein
MVDSTTVTTSLPAPTAVSAVPQVPTIAKRAKKVKIVIPRPIAPPIPAESTPTPDVPKNRTAPPAVVTNDPLASSLAVHESRRVSLAGVHEILSKFDNDSPL